MMTAAADEEFYNEMLEQYGGVFARNLSEEKIVPVLVGMLKNKDLAKLTGKSVSAISHAKKEGVAVGSDISSVVYEFYLETTELTIEGTEDADYIPMYTQSDVADILNQLNGFFKNMTAETDKLRKTTMTAIRSVRDNAPKDELEMNARLTDYADRERRTHRPAKKEIAVTRVSEKENRSTEENNGRPVRKIRQKSPVSKAFERSEKTGTFRIGKPAVECEGDVMKLRPDAKAEVYTDGTDYTEYPVGRFYRTEEDWKKACGFGNPAYDGFYNALSIRERYIMELIHLFKFSRAQQTVRTFDISNGKDLYAIQRENIMTDIPTFWYVFAKYGDDMLDVMRKAVFGIDNQHSMDADGTYVPSEYVPQDRPPFENIKEFREWLADRLAWGEKHAFTDCRYVGRHPMSEMNIIEVYNARFGRDFCTACSTQGIELEYRFDWEHEYVCVDGRHVRKEEYQQMVSDKERLKELRRIIPHFKDRREIASDMEREYRLAQGEPVTHDDYEKWAEEQRNNGVVNPKLSEFKVDFRKLMIRLNEENNRKQAWESEHAELLEEYHQLIGA